jgi:hypothetical protein
MPGGGLGERGLHPGTVRRGHRLHGRRCRRGRLGAIGVGRAGPVAGHGLRLRRLRLRGVSRATRPGTVFARPGSTVRVAVRERLLLRGRSSCAGVVRRRSPLAHRATVVCLRVGEPTVRHRHLEADWVTAGAAHRKAGLLLPRDAVVLLTEGSTKPRGEQAGLSLLPEPYRGGWHDEQPSHRVAAPQQRYDHHHHSGRVCQTEQDHAESIRRWKAGVTTSLALRRSRSHRCGLNH